MSDWDIVLLGCNTDAILDFKISEHFNFGGFFLEPEPPRMKQLQGFTKENLQRNRRAASTMH